MSAHRKRTFSYIVKKLAMPHEDAPKPGHIREEKSRLQLLGYYLVLIQNHGPPGIFKCRMPGM